MALASLISPALETADDLARRFEALTGGFYAIPQARGPARGMTPRSPFRHRRPGREGPRARPDSRWSTSLPELLTCSRRPAYHAPAVANG
jgi:hypothetical protein